METLFMHATKRPLAGALEFAAHAFTAWDFDRDTSFRVLRFKDKTFVTGARFRIVARNRAITGHFILQTNAAPHGGRPDIFDVCVRSTTTEVRFRSMARHFMTTHEFSLSGTVRP
jgi:hypothetical protein